MGAANSSSKKRQNNWSWKGPPGDHSPFPVDRIPYPGSDLLYCFVDLMVSHKILKNQINLGPPAVATNIEQFMARITDCYEHGFVLVKFARVPSVKMTIELTDWTAQQPYQAILVKPASRESDSKESWELRAEKRILSTRTLSYNESDTESDFLNTIRTYAEGGARLVSAESVGFVRSDTTNTQYGIMGVELFFNVPRHSFTTKYTYHTITLPATYHVIHDVTQLGQKVVCDADFLGQLKLFLNAGWKLIDICLDGTAIAETYRTKVQSKRIETIWIFEKETEKLFDETPLYEGAIIEYLHKVKMTSEGESPCRDWRPVIAGMGVSGWELASIVQTPLLVQSTFTVYTMKMLFIFQRPLARTVAKARLAMHRSAGHGGSGGGSRAADRGLFDSAAYPHGARRSFRAPGPGDLGRPGGGGSQFYGNNTMSVGPMANGFVKFASSSSSSGAPMTMPGSGHPPQRERDDSLRTYTTRGATSHDDDESCSSSLQTPRSVQLPRARRDRSTADKIRPKSGGIGQFGTSSGVRGGGGGERSDNVAFMTSSNDEEGGLDDCSGVGGGGGQSRHSSSISSSTDNGCHAVNFGKLSVFSPVVEIPTS